LIYANEIDSNAAHWLSRIPVRIDRIDDRSIVDVKGKDLDGFTQCHFFAGIGGWPLALEMASWPDDAPVWTGSCPCQPFSSAGKRKGTADERHLWPEFLRLISECKPPTIFGEQVASKAGRDWLATVRTDLEALGYAVGAADLCAAGVGAPHIRQRLFWVADSGSQSRQRDARRFSASKTRERSEGQFDGDCNHRLEHDGSIHGMADSEIVGCDGRVRCESGKPIGNGRGVASGRGDERMGNAESFGCREESQRRSDIASQDQRWQHIARRPITTNWIDVEFIPCRDGKARPIKPGICCLDHGISGRVAQLRGLGNAIVPQVAAAFISAFMETQA